MSDSMKSMENDNGPKLSKSNITGGANPMYKTSNNTCRNLGKGGSLKSQNMFAPGKQMGDGKGTC